MVRGLRATAPIEASATYYHHEDGDHANFAPRRLGSEEASALISISLMAGEMGLDRVAWIM